MIKQKISTLLDKLRIGALARNTFKFLKYILDIKLITKNMKFIRNGAPDGLPLQTPGLAYLVCGQYDLEAMYYNGMKGAEWITELLGRNGLQFSEFTRILDFGCGCGRIMRFWRDYSPKVRIYGTDYNASLVNWCNENLPFTTVSVNSIRPPTEYSDDSFDLVYAISVFTHLSSDQQKSWLDEIIRITRSSGYIIITVHGKDRASVLSEDQQRMFDNGDLVVVGEQYCGSNNCGVYHPRYYFDKIAFGSLVEVDYVERGAVDADQDIFLFKVLP